MNNLENLNNYTTGLFILKFGAKWCGPCKTIKPLFDKIKEEFPDIQIVDLDTDDNKHLVEKYSITAVPTTLFIKNNEITNKIVGSMLIASLRTACRKLQEI